MTRLTRAQPAPHRGIVHLGIGAFARAHTAVYTELAMQATGDDRWGITAVTGRSADIANRLAPQGGLFSVLEKDAGRSSVSVIGSVVEAVAGGHELAALADPRVTVVTLTITEKGYHLDPLTGGLDLRDEQIRHDLDGGPAATAIGRLVRGLLARAAVDAPPLSILSCDNLPGNGEMLGRLVWDFADNLPAADQRKLRDQLAGARFPSSMVDRMVPATTATDLDEVETLLGLRDEAAVVAEPFRQWVISGEFAGTRPSWEAAGAQLVDDVAPWEAAKLRLLNATHSLLAYLGLAAGHRTIAEAVADPAFEVAARRLMADDALPNLVLPAGFDGPQYCEDVIRRFANPALGHTTAKVGSDGSQKLAPRLLATARAAGTPTRWVALAVALWMAHVVRTPATQLDDPLADVLAQALTGCDGPDQIVAALLGIDRIFGDLADDTPFTDTVRDWFRLADRRGLDAVRQEILA